MTCCLVLSIFIRKNIPHRIVTHQDKLMLKYFLVCAHHPSKNHLVNFHLRSAGFTQIQAMDEIIDLFELILSNANIEPHKSSAICDSLAKPLIIKLSKMPVRLIIPNPEPGKHTNEFFSTLEKTIIRSRASSTLRTMQGNLDSAYLSRVFKRFHKEPPYKFSYQIEMSHAASLLLNLEIW